MLRKEFKDEIIIKIEKTIIRELKYSSYKDFEYKGNLELDEDRYFSFTLFLPINKEVFINECDSLNFNILKIKPVKNGCYFKVETQMDFIIFDMENRLL